MQKPLAIAIDLGGTQLRAALVDRNGGIVSRASVATDVAGGPERVIEQIRLLCGEIDVAGRRAEIAGVGVSTPGPLDSEAGTIIAISTLPGWEEFPIVARLAGEFGLPVVLENDGIAAANGEWMFGAARGLQHFVYVTVSTGIGGGVVVDGRLLHGRRGMAGHVGHMIIAPEGPRCSCGALGCFEALASGSALARSGREAVATQPSSLLAQQPARNDHRARRRRGCAPGRQPRADAARTRSGMARHRLQQSRASLQPASDRHGRRRLAGIRPAA